MSTAMSPEAKITAGRMAAVQPVLDQMRAADSAFEAKNQAKLQRLYQQMARIPWQQASIVSLHPFTLTNSNPLTNELRLGPAPLSNDDRFAKIVLRNGRKLGYTHHVFTTWARDLVPNDAGEVEPAAILPIDLALDFMGQYYHTDPGGIFCYEGTTAPELLSEDAVLYVQADRTGRTRGGSKPLHEGLEFIHDKQVAHYMKWKNDADEAWNGTDDKKRNIIGRSNVVKMVRMLRSWGELTEDPAWVKAPIKRSSGESVTCKSCGAESKPGALKCTNGSCTYVFHPFKAFSDLVIDLNTPGAGLALRRLAPNQVMQLVRWKRFTREEAEEAGYRFPKKGAGAEGDETEPDPNAAEGDGQTGEPQS